MAMASLTASSSAITLLNKPFVLNRSSFFSSSSISHHRLLRFSASAFIRAVSLESDTSETPSFEIEETQIFACPVYYERLMRKSPHVLTCKFLPFSHYINPILLLMIEKQSVYRSGFKCGQCNKTYSSKDEYLDLTVTADLDNFNDIKPITTELFRSPLVSFCIKGVGEITLSVAVILVLRKRTAKFGSSPF
ncbi:unnamed protein product [Arabis nemorensis]|uniref:Uncharacterized protein n=1 Tax=Arabis nemorensis TaxID=586526 RepID=A0A565BDG9_9BRAS|nr:unnamed protein product [Arabis nemorensis]